MIRKGHINCSCNDTRRNDFSTLGDRDGDLGDNKRGRRGGGG